jgi:hypothetical protein
MPAKFSSDPHAGKVVASTEFEAHFARLKDEALSSEERAYAARLEPEVRNHNNAIGLAFAMSAREGALRRAFRQANADGTEGLWCGEDGLYASAETVLGLRAQVYGALDWRQGLEEHREKVLQLARAAVVLCADHRPRVVSGKLTPLF